MKRFNLLAILIAFALIALLPLPSRTRRNNATKSDLEAVRLELKAQIDSVLKNQDRIKTELLEDPKDFVIANQKQK